MTEKRKKVQAYILKHITTLDPSGVNTKRYEQFFTNLSDEEFDQYMHDLKNKDDQIYIYMPNLDSHLSLDNILKAGDDLNLNLFERVWLTDTATGSTYLTPKQYMILELPIRRVRQFLEHKLSVPESDKNIDLLSGQVIKPDKAAALSLVEMQTMIARNLDKTLTELAKYRGGDIYGYAELKRSLEESGSGKLPEDTTTLTRSTIVFDVLLSGMHIDSNIIPGSKIIEKENK